MKSFVINLEKRTERLQIFKKNFKNYDLSFEVFKAVDPISDKLNLGYYTDKDVLHSLKYKLNNKIDRTHHAELSSIGAIGCYLSHYNLWKNLIYDSHAQHYIIFEDDAYPVYNNNDFDNHINDILEEIPTDFDILCLGTIYEKPSSLNSMKFAAKLDFFLGMHAYIISKKCAIKLLDNALPIKIQVDSYLSNSIKPLKLKVYSAKKSLFKQQGLSTDIQLLNCTGCENIWLDSYSSILKITLLVVLFSILLVCFYSITPLEYKFNFILTLNFLLLLLIILSKNNLHKPFLFL